MDTQSRAADIWRDALIFYLKINAHVCRPSFSQSCREMESTCHLAAVVFASQTSSIIKSAEDVPRQAERKRLYNGVTRAARAVRRISTNSRKSQAQSPPPVHSKQTDDTFHHSLTRHACFLDDYRLDGLRTRWRDACIWGVCVCVGDVLKFN